MRNVVFFAVIMLFNCNSCKKSSNDAGTAVYGVRIHFIDSSGSDLFSSGNDGQNGYWKDSVALYDITNTKTPLQSCYEGGRSYQFEQLNVLRMDICENTDFASRYSYTLIQLKKNLQDTIKVHIDQNSVNPGTNNDSVWYNNILRRYDSTGTITVVK
jgi:hypothetical protein